MVVLEICHRINRGEQKNIQAKRAQKQRKRFFLFLFFLSSLLVHPITLIIIIFHVVLFILLFAPVISLLYCEAVVPSRVSFLFLGKEEQALKHSYWYSVCPTNII